MPLVALALLTISAPLASADPACRVGANGKSDCPMDSSGVDAWIFYEVWYDRCGCSLVASVDYSTPWFAYCDQSEDVCTDSDPTTDDEAGGDPCAPCTSEPTGPAEPDPVQPGVCWTPAVVVCPATSTCDMDGADVMIEGNCH